MAPIRTYPYSTLFGLSQTTSPKWNAHLSVCTSQSTSTCCSDNFTSAQTKYMESFLTLLLSHFTLTILANPVGSTSKICSKVYLPHNSTATKFTPLYYKKTKQNTKQPLNLVHSFYLYFQTIWTWPPSDLFIVCVRTGHFDTQMLPLMQNESYTLIKNYKMWPNLLPPSSFWFLIPLHSHYFLCSCHTGSLRFSKVLKMFLLWSLCTESSLYLTCFSCNICMVHSLTSFRSLFSHLSDFLEVQLPHHHLPKHFLTSFSLLHNTYTLIHYTIY